MDRRSFLGAVGAAAVTVTGPVVASPAIAQGTIQWRMVSRWPEPFPDQLESGRRLAQRIADMSDGRITVEVLGPNELGEYRETFDKVAAGEVEMARSLSYDWRDRGLAFDVFMVVPFGMTETERAVWLQGFDGQRLWDELYAGFGVKPFLAGTIGPQAFGWFAEPLTSIEQLQGLRYRTTGINVPIMEALGAAPVSMGRRGIGPAVEADELDAFELVGPAVDLAYDLHTFLPTYLFPSYHQTAGTIELIVNRERFEALPSDLQQIVAHAAETEHMANVSRVHASNVVALETLKAEHGVQTGLVPDEILTRIGEVASDILSEARRAAPAEHQRIFDSFVTARGRIRAWTELTEGPFTRSRTLPFAYPIAG